METTMGDAIEATEELADDPTLTCPKCGADATGRSTLCNGCDGEGGWTRHSNSWLDPDEWYDCRECEGCGRMVLCEGCGHEAAAAEFEGVA